MNITLLHIEECPSWEEAGERLERALAATGHGDERVDVVLLNTPEEAGQYPFAGSPTILVGGVDLFPRCGDHLQPGLSGISHGRPACRVADAGTDR